MKLFSTGGCFLRKVHAGDTQTASGTGKFGVLEGTARTTGDIVSMGTASQTGEFQVAENQAFFRRVPGFFHVLFSGRVAFSEKGKLQLALAS